MKYSIGKFVTLFQGGYFLAEEENKSSGSVRKLALMGAWFSFVSLLLSFIAYNMNCILQETLIECISSSLRLQDIIPWIIILCSSAAGVIGTHKNKHNFILQYVLVGSFYCAYINLNIVYNDIISKPFRSFSPIIVYVFIWQVLETFALSVMYNYVQEIEVDCNANLFI